MLVAVSLIYLAGGLLISHVSPKTIAPEEEKDDNKEHQMNPKVGDIVLDCMTENHMTMEDMKKMSSKDGVETENMKCLMACSFKKMGVMDEDGKLSLEGSIAATKEYMGDDPETLKKSENVTKACEYVNEVPVSDGNKGCERASLIYKCSTEKELEFGLV